MKKIVFCLLFLGLTHAVLFAQVGIGTMTPANAAGLEIKSTDKGFLLPRMTQTQMDAIASPAEALMVYCLDCSPKGVYYFDGTSFVTHTKPAGSIASLNCAGTIYSGSLLYYQNTAGVTASVPYTGSNGGFYNEITINSTGVTGLTAYLAYGEFSPGSGNLVFTISGMPLTLGTATFTFTIYGQPCSFTMDVIVPTVTSATGKVWMDRNLGATQVAANYKDTNSYGDLYQWGRQKEGHQLRNSLTYNGPIADPNLLAAQGRFVKNSSPDFDWLITMDNFRWNSGTEVTPVKVIANDPCPTGFRVPTRTEWDNEVAQLGLTNSYDAFNSILKLPEAGYRERGGNLVLSSAAYTSSTAIAFVRQVYVLRFSTSSLSVDYNSNNRAAAFSVRCIQE